MDEVDLLVVGAGAGGMAAALAASIEGMSVLVCEKSAQVGGTAATSAGTLWIPGDAEDAERYLDALLPEGTGRTLRAAYLAAGPRAIEFFAEKSDVKFLAAGMHPDYVEAPGAAASGRALVPVPFDGRLLGADFNRVRPPIAEFMLLGGMMVGKADIVTLLGAKRSLSKFLRSAALVTRYALDRLRHPRGTRLVMGNALVARLFFSLRERKVPMLFQASLTDLMRDAEGIRGAIVSHAGQKVQIRARKGVLLATGGLGRNAELRRRLMPAPFTEYSLTATSNTGDGVGAALRAGAGVAGGRTGGLWTPVSATGRKDADGFFPHLILDRAKPGLIAVDRAGRRFVNEACSYHDFVEAMFRAQAIPAYLICDATFVRRYGLGMIHPGTRNLRRHVERGYVHCADTLDALARAASIDAEG
ncbi:MAG TPA: FAD-dependent oxidoreductase, partial [Burkholderiales bacterium]|nr:FAD-dependent oxidoreductase [Burkholderiales bacterium]